MSIDVRNPVTGRFAPGHCPPGRPKGFAGVAKMIAAQTDDGRELVEFALTVLRLSDAKMSDRLAAHAWLSDRYLGRPLQQLELGKPGAFDEESQKRAEELTDEQLDRLVELDRQRAAILNGGRVTHPMVVDEKPALSPTSIARAIDVSDEK